MDRVADLYPQPLWSPEGRVNLGRRSEPGQEVRRGQRGKVVNQGHEGGGASRAGAGPVSRGRGQDRGRGRRLTSGDSGRRADLAAALKPAGPQAAPARGCPGSSAGSEDFERRSVAPGASSESASATVDRRAGQNQTPNRGQPLVAGSPALGTAR